MAKSYLQGITLQIGGDTSGLEKAIKGVTSEVTSLNSKIRTLDQALKVDPTNIDLLRQKYDLLTQNVDKTQERLTKLKEAQDQFLKAGGDINSKEYIQLESDIVRTENTLKKLTDQQKSFNAEVEQLSAAAKKAGDSMTNFGNKTQNASLLATGAIVATSKSAIDFESAWTGVTKTVEGTEDQLASIRDGIFDLSKSTASSASEIAQVAENAGQLGIATDDVLEFTKTMIMLGDSTNLSADEASTALAKFTNITKTTADDYSRLGSTIVALGNASASTESEIVEMATRLASSGELAGLSEAQILALSTALSSVGIEAEAGGSAMSKLIKQIQVSVELGNKDLENFAKVAGVSMEEFADVFRTDATKALAMFVDGLNDTERNGKSAIAILDDMGITEVRLSNAVLSLASNSDVLTNAIDVANKGWNENTALQDEASRRYATTESKLIQTKNAIVEASVSLGEAFLPTIQDVAEAVGDFAEWLNDLDPSVKKAITTSLAFVAVLSPISKGLGSVSTSLSNLKKPIGSLINLLKGTNTEGQTQLGLLQKFPASLSGWGIGITAFLGVATGLSIWAKSVNDEYNEQLNLIQSNIDAYASLKETQQEQMSQGLNELEYYKNLKKELDSIVGANGQVKESYEGRAEFIINELNSALGTELSLNDGLIESYDELSNALDDNIEKQRAKILLDSQQAVYQEAVQKVNEATTKQLNLQAQLADEENRLLEAKTALVEKYGEVWEDSSGVISSELYGQYLELSNSVDQTGKELEKQKELVRGYNEDIMSYETNYQYFKEGQYDKLEQMYQGDVQAYSDSVTEKQMLQAQEILSLQNQLNTYKQKYAETNNQIYLDQINSTREQLNAEVEKLDSMIGLVDGKKQDTAEVWRALGLAGVEGIEETYQAFYGAGSSLASGANKGYKNSLNLKTPTEQSVASLVSGKITSVAYGVGQKIAGFFNSGYKNAQQIGSPSKVWEEFGEWQAEGLEIGLQDRLANIGEIVANSNKLAKSSLKDSIGQAQLAIKNASPKIYVNVRTDLDGKDITKHVETSITTSQNLRTNMKGA